MFISSVNVKDSELERTRRVMEREKMNWTTGRRRKVGREWKIVEGKTFRGKIDIRRRRCNGSQGKLESSISVGLSHLAHSTEKRSRRRRRRGGKKENKPASKIARETGECPGDETFLRHYSKQYTTEIWHPPGKGPLLYRVYTEESGYKGSEIKGTKDVLSSFVEPPESAVVLTNA